MSESESVVLGALRVELIAHPDGELTVSTDVEGVLQYVTAMGMLEMAKGSLDELLGDDEDD